MRKAKNFLALSYQTKYFPSIDLVLTLDDAELDSCKILMNVGWVTITWRLIRIFLSSLHFQNVIILEYL